MIKKIIIPISVFLILIFPTVSTAEKQTNPQIPYTDSVYSGTDNANKITYQAVDLTKEIIVNKNGTSNNYIQSLNIKVSTNNTDILNKLSNYNSFISCKVGDDTELSLQKLPGGGAFFLYFWKKEVPSSCNLNIVIDGNAYAYPETVLISSASGGASPPTNNLTPSEKKKIEKKIASKKKTCYKRHGKKTSNKYKKNCLKQVKNLEKKLK